MIKYIYLPCKKGAYIVPEYALHEHGLISNTDENIKGKTITLHPFHTGEKLEKVKTAWMNDYLYFYDKDMDKIRALFDNTDKTPYVNDYVNPISFGPYIKPEIPQAPKIKIRIKEKDTVSEQSNSE